MSLPTKIKTWSIDPCNRVTYVSLLQSVSDCMLQIKNALKLMSGVTVKGSCNGTTGAMDGTDRWSITSDVQTRNNGVAGPQSWIVLDCANMGGAEFLLTYNASAQQGFAFYFSPGGNYVVAGTTTHKPTATDEVTIRVSAGLTSTGTGDRLWSSWVASDGSALAFAITQAGSWETFVGLQIVTSRVESPATFSPAVVGWDVGSQAGVTAAFGSWGTAAPACRVNGGAGAANVAGFFGAEGVKTGVAGGTYANVAELQGGGHNIYPISVWSETATARGAVGNLIDVWAGNSGASDGDTYPNDATRTFIHVGDFILPWDGSAVAMA